MDALTVIDRFNAAFGKHDVDAVMALMTADCVFENTAPPDGRRYTGQAEVRGAWEELFAGSPGAVFDAEEVVALGERVVVRWVYRWGDDDSADQNAHVRGIDLFRVEGDLVAEKLSYVKG
ncbi:nuclear transport factor 2 family protein [Spongisporangium articulatum]|uniref:Nuclear transport factor 2 family protein n=1 Tax=Spongisporangium articulatum TaxID=3362603 RepID=A0ABW8AMY6_9ACTN